MYIVWLYIVYPSNKMVYDKHCIQVSIWLTLKGVITFIGTRMHCFFAFNRSHTSESILRSDHMDVNLIKIVSKWVFEKNTTTFFYYITAIIKNDYPWRPNFTRQLRLTALKTFLKPFTKWCRHPSVINLASVGWILIKAYLLTMLLCRLWTIRFAFLLNRVVRKSHWNFEKNRYKKSLVRNVRFLSIQNHVKHYVFVVREEKGMFASRQRSEQNRTELTSVTLLLQGNEAFSTSSSRCSDSFTWHSR